MNPRILFVLATASLTASLASAQSQPTTYATVIYAKFKPGMAAQSLKFQQEVGEKGAAALVRSGEAQGFVRLVRVFPSTAQVGHDVIYYYVRSNPPTFGAASPTFEKGSGMTREEFEARRVGLNETVRQELWTNVFRHGSIEKGDFVNLLYVDPPMGRTPDYLDVMREYESGMQAQLVQDGLRKASGLWRLWNTAEEEPYNFVWFRVYKEAAGLFSPPARSRQEVFNKAHPGKDYASYIRRYEASVNFSNYVVYRVDAAIWK